MEFKVRGSGLKQPIKDSAIYLRGDFDLADIEAKKDELLADYTEDRPCKMASCSISFKAVGPRAATWHSVRIQEFSFAETIKLLNQIDQSIQALKPREPVTDVDLKAEFSVQIEALEKAFPRNRSVNEPSSDAPIESTPKPRNNRTTQMIREQRMEQRQEEIRDSMDHQKHLMQHWKCIEPRCLNYMGNCYFDPLTNGHYPIQPVNTEAWARAIQVGEAEIARPSQAIILSLRMNGNKLQVNPNTGRKKQGSSSPDSKDLSKIYGQFMKQTMQQQMFSSIVQMSSQQQLQMERQQASRGYNSMPPILSTAASSSQPSQKTGAAAPSSPVNTGGNSDNLETVEALFTWLIASKSGVEKDAYQHAMDVALGEFWTISDLQSMSDPKGNMYELAVDRFKLKDGVVRHLRAHIRQFKGVFRAAATLDSLSGV